MPEGARCQARPQTYWVFLSQVTPLLWASVSPSEKHGSGHYLQGRAAPASIPPPGLVSSALWFHVLKATWWGWWQVTAGGTSGTAEKGSERKCSFLRAPFFLRCLRPQLLPRGCSPHLHAGEEIQLDRRPGRKGRAGSLTLHLGPGVSNLHTRWARETHAAAFHPAGQLLVAGLMGPMTSSPLPGAQLGGTRKATDKEAVPGTGDTCPKTGLPACPAPTKGRAWPAQECGRRRALVLSEHAHPPLRQCRYTPSAMGPARPSQPHA